MRSSAKEFRTASLHDLRNIANGSLTLKQTLRFKRNHRDGLATPVAAVAAAAAAAAATTTSTLSQLPTLPVPSFLCPFSKSLVLSIHPPHGGPLPSSSSPPPPLPLSRPHPHPTTTASVIRDPKEKEREKIVLNTTLLTSSFDKLKFNHHDTHWTAASAPTSSPENFTFYLSQQAMPSARSSTHPYAS
ncbi:hypothetical protein BDF20DRAFT_908985 [Mycotypha africana]|uniref:uncharacterized protein n=1 Tax=Mycotypha africana TaxID=64632 RepID=UPI002301457B|nr:uncharacterized protein BDF20DRAFT_908985 [Mycotypha africana]KAI8991168.1 hypothetical protein BDF20DRAFT_908985 [Mycotypha africana]